MMRRLLIIMLLSGLLLRPTVLAGSDRAGVSPLFSLGAGGRALAMGGANAALANDASALFWNSAALTQLPERSLSLMHLSLPEDTYYDFAAFAWPTVDYGTFAVGAFLMTTDGLQQRDNSGLLLGEFNANQQMYLLAYGKQITGYLSLGLAIKLYGHNIGNYSAFGAGGDLGLRLSLTDNISIGVNAQNVLAPQVTLDSDKETLPYNLKAGVGVGLPLADGRHRLSLEVDVDKTEAVDPVVHVGAELALLGSYFIRGGYDVDQFSVGGGLRFQMVTVGYNYRTDDFFDPQHRLSLDISLGGSVESMLATREADRRAAAEQLATQQRENNLREAMAQAREFFAQGQYDSAQVYYAKVSALSGGSESESAERLREISERRSDELSASVRISTLAESDSVKTEEMFTELDQSLADNNLELSRWLLDQLRPGYSQTARYQQLEADYGTNLSREINRLQRQARRDLDNGDYAAAAVNYSHVLQLNPDDRNARNSLRRLNSRVGALELLRRGIAAMELGDTTTALASFQRILENNPDDSVAADLAARLAIDSDSARTSSLATIQSDPEVWKLYLKGIEEFREGRYQQAIDLWNQVLATYPGNSEALKNIEQAKLRLHSSAISE